MAPASSKLNKGLEGPFALFIEGAFSTAKLPDGRNGVSIHVPKGSSAKLLFGGEHGKAPVEELNDSSEDEVEFIAVVTAEEKEAQAKLLEEMSVKVKKEGSIGSFDSSDEEIVPKKESGLKSVQDLTVDTEDAKNKPIKKKQPKKTEVKSEKESEDTSAVAKLSGEVSTKSVSKKTSKAGSNAKASSASNVEADKPTRVSKRSKSKSKKATSN